MSREEIFTRSTINPDFDPSKIVFRESRDSEANPASTPIILACDVTGSMGQLAETIVKHDLGEIMKQLYDARPVTDPHIMCMAIGDSECDQAPLQCTQFEADIRIAKQLEEIWLEGGGGGNGGESYPLAWFFAAYKTKVDSIKKRKHKGYLFTIGDESPLPTIRRPALKRFLGVDAQSDMDSKTLFEHALGDWEIFHLIVKPVTTQNVVADWRAMIGQRAIVVPDITKLAAGIVATIEYMERGAAPDKARWAADTHVTIEAVSRQVALIGSGS